jgi:hypothetical protein
VAALGKELYNVFTAVKPVTPPVATTLNNLTCSPVVELLKIIFAAVPSHRVDGTLLTLKTALGRTVIVTLCTGLLTQLAAVL